MYRCLRRRPAGPLRMLARVLTLFVPRAIPLVLGGLGLLWGVPTIVALITGGRSNAMFTVLNLLMASGLLAFAVRVSLISVRLDEEGVAVRSWVRTRSTALPQVKGIALLQDGGVPRLTVVTTDRPLQTAAWSLRARYEDGETEPAGPALERFGAEHGVKVKVRQLNGPVVE